MNDIDLVYSIVSLNRMDFVKMVSNILKIENKNNYIIYISLNKNNINDKMFNNTIYEKIIKFNFTDIEKKSLFDLHIENFNKVNYKYKFKYFFILSNESYLYESPKLNNFVENEEKFIFTYKPRFFLKIA